MHPSQLAAIFVFYFIPTSCGFYADVSWSTSFNGKSLGDHSVTGCCNKEAGIYNGILFEFGGSPGLNVAYTMNLTAPNPTWTSLGPILPGPTWCKSQCTVQMGKYLYHASMNQAQLWRIDIETLTAIGLAAIPSSAWGMCLTSDGSDGLYVIGGENSYPTRKYTISTELWTTETSLARKNPLCGYYNGYLYANSGMTMADDDINTIYKYQAGSHGSWTFVMTTTPRSMTSWVLWRGVWAVVGGSTSRPSYETHSEVILFDYQSESTVDPVQFGVVDPLPMNITTAHPVVYGDVLIVPASYGPVYVSVLHYPSQSPTISPSSSPTNSPSTFPSSAPTFFPSTSPTSGPSQSPSATPSESPSGTPSRAPTSVPSTTPSSTPSVVPSTNPAVPPTSSPSTSPIDYPTFTPSRKPSISPTSNPTAQPSKSPSRYPSHLPSENPTRSPTSDPSSSTGGLDLDQATPSHDPTQAPSFPPSFHPTSKQTPPIRESAVDATPYIVMAVVSMTAFIFFVLSRVFGPDDPRKSSTAVFFWFASMFDVWSDVAFIYQLFTYASTDMFFFFLFAFAAGIFIVSFMSSFRQLAKFLNVALKNKNFRTWLQANRTSMALLSLVSLSNLHAMRIIDSRVFSYDIFQAPLSDKEGLQLEVYGFWSMLIEDIPQFVVQMIASVRLGQVTPLTLMSATAIITASLKYLFNHLLIVSPQTPHDPDDPEMVPFTPSLRHQQEKDDEEDAFTFQQ